MKTTQRAARVEERHVKGDDISERLVDFAVRVIRLVEALPETRAGNHVGGQLLRCGTSAGANYEEARGAESGDDFAHKVGVSGKETRESGFWLRVIRKPNWFSRICRRKSSRNHTS